MVIVGIDPGYTGAIVFLDPATMDITVHDMPMTKAAKGKEVLNLHALADLMVPPTSRCIGIIERVQTMPRQGISSAFRFGECFGALQMALAGHGYDTRYVAPHAWKKHFKISSDKGVSRGLAIQRFPAHAKTFARVKDDGRAEAALIALYGAETLALRPNLPSSNP
jgi:crossover junction endodeoxyribonuclease RuvC